MKKKDEVEKMTEYEERERWYYTDNIKNIILSKTFGQ